MSKAAGKVFSVENCLKGIEPTLLWLGRKVVNGQHYCQMKRLITKHTGEDGPTLLLLSFVSGKKGLT